jgi:hypothetical protein
MRKAFLRFLFSKFGYTIVSTDSLNQLEGEYFRYTTTEGRPYWKKNTVVRF